MKTTEITAGELYTTGTAAEFEPSAMFILDTTTPVLFSTSQGAEMGTLRKAKKGEAKRMLAILAIQKPESIREHLEELRALNVNDLLGETQMSTKLPRGTFMRAISPAMLKGTFDEVTAEQARIEAERKAEEKAAREARAAEYDKVMNLSTMIRKAGIPATGPGRIEFDFEGHATLTTETLTKLLIAANRASR
ncbi:hypothetical protein GCM10025867_51060 (plasmid) [Frondihabitans sucicola]|uniref:Uncharacterized protein n=1 Tax=Frondihabitans sucicola TaxID=1268041 RepID=A0ABN6YA86_9MICO|nr:hypothetical protein [Frondihabitans sucicola]BDZ52299.1 hypothetical protein GCM10025867_45400 [Frondihabitans sucicola]BDZ52865.1 hypothetical protein GCM10025867_51060 [Frondihabitans sucicola]